MGHEASKLRGIYLPAQSGKTRKAQEAIRDYKLITDLEDYPSDLHIWISANNRLLVHQTTVRMQNDLGSSTDKDGGIQGNVFSWMSGSKKANVTVHDLAFKIIRGMVGMVVVCANAKRLEYVSNLVKELDGAYHSHDNGQKITFWIDEADMSERQWIQYDTILSLPVVREVNLVSATMDSIFSTFGEIRIKGYPDTHPACYRRLKDMDTVKIDLVGSSSVDYIRHVLENYSSDLIIPGKRAFLPGDFTKKSHEEIALMLVSLGFAVIILNGSIKELRVPHKDPIDLSGYLALNGSYDPPEFNKSLARIYYDNQLHKYPFAITGFMCVERGITFQIAPEDVSIHGKHRSHDGFLFDYGIIPHVRNKSEAYQLMARLFGNIGDFPNYKPCTIYSTSGMFDMVSKQEEIAVNLAKLVYDENISMVHKGIVKRAANLEEDSQWEFYQEEYKTLEEVNASLIQWKLPTRNPDFDTSDTRFYVSTTSSVLSRLSYDNVMNEIANWSKLTALSIRSNTKKAARLIICYRDLTDPDSVVFILRRVINKSQ